MCLGKPKVKVTQQAAPAIASTQEAKAPTQAALLINSSEKQRRRQGYAALLRTPPTGLGGAPITTRDTRVAGVGTTGTLGMVARQSLKQTLGG